MMNLVTSAISNLYILGVREHVLRQVMFPEECSIAEVTLELLRTGVDEHM